LPSFTTTTGFRSNDREACTFDLIEVDVGRIEQHQAASCSHVSGRSRHELAVRSGRDRHAPQPVLD
jgi:hypothetical protein